MQTTFTCADGVYLVTDLVSLDFFVEPLPGNAKQFRSLHFVSPGPAQRFFDTRYLKFRYALREGQALRTLDQCRRAGVPPFAQLLGTILP
jgi:hypothetical protein